MTSIVEVGSGEALVAEAYERVKGEMAALKPEELLLPTLDVQHAVTTILGALPEIKKLRAELVKAVSDFDGVAFDKLEDYAQALGLAQAKYQFATDPPDELEEVFAEAAKHRERMIANARALALSDLFDDRKLEQLKHGNGFNNVAQDLQALSAAFQENWTNIAGKTALSLEEVQAGSRVGLRLSRLVGFREQGPAALAEWTENRRRAFTLASRAYDEVRAALRYLRRREGDADTIAPTLYATSGGRRRQADEPTAVPAGSVPPPAPGSAPGAAPAVSPAHPAVVASNGAPAASATNGAVAAAGPFTS